jgi:microcystin-dependent protein
VSDQFVAEIRPFATNFPPIGWALCDGQLLPISQNTALFSLLGTNYGGDGKSTFALPDLQGRTAVAAGTGPSGREYFLGESSGAEFVTLTSSEMPAHNHMLQGRAAAGTLQAPGPTRVLARDGNGNLYQTNLMQQAIHMHYQSLTVAGSGFPHNNMPPYLAINYCIALQGYFPPRQ